MVVIYRDRKSKDIYLNNQLVKNILFNNDLIFTQIFQPNISITRSKFAIIGGNGERTYPAEVTIKNENLEIATIYYSLSWDSESSIYTKFESVYPGDSITKIESNTSNFSRRLYVKAYALINNLSSAINLEYKLISGTTIDEPNLW